MKGKSDEEILIERKRAIQCAERQLNEPVEVIDSFFQSAPADAKPLWFLGKSLELLSTADIAYFAKGWEDAMALKQSWKIIPMTEHYTVTKDADRLAPNWLASRINYKTVKLLYRDIDGHAELKGVKIGDEVAQIGDTVQFNGRRLSVERR